MAIHQREFPFIGLKRDDDNMFDSVEEATKAGHAQNQIWSVAEHDGTWTYGPPHHYVNVLGYIGTKETHDYETYYEEPDEEEE